MKPHLFGRELKQCGRVILGDRQILDLIPPFTAEELSREEAWQLLMNRAIELLRAQLGQGGGEAHAVAYCTAKLYLDMATSFLIFAGQHRSGYRARYERLAELAEAGAICVPFALRPFAQRVAASTAYKLGEAEHLDKRFSRIADAIEYAHQLWRWELIQLSDASPIASDTVLLETWRARQPFRARLHGWLALARRAFRSTQSLNFRLSARLIYGASPRMWTYMAASAALFGAGSATAASWDSLPLRLPQDFACRDTSSLLARAVVWNYENALWGTRS
jgi:hypothetical protein